MFVLEPDQLGPRRPIDHTPPRAAGSIRRTSTIDSVRPDGPGGDLVVDARARDLLTTGDGLEADTVVLDEVRVVLRADGASYEIREIRATGAGTGAPRPESLDGLVGARAGRGFRAAVGRLLPELEASRAPLLLLLDDLPGATLVSGYALLRSDDIGQVAAEAFEARADVCSGWVRDGAMMRAIRETGRTPTPVGPVSPSLARSDDPLAWHDIPELPPGATRRRRRIDVHAPAVPPASHRVDVMFRDSHADDDGLETSIHEYAVDAEVDGRTRTVAGIEAAPRVLPWVECPAAADSATRLVGRPLADLRSHVRETFTGITTCTHLNDVLRGLADVDALVDRLSDPLPPRP